MPGEISNTIGGRIFVPSQRVEGIHKVGCQLRLLANTSSSRITTLNHFPYSIWPILLQPSYIWDHVGSRTLSTSDCNHPTRPLCQMDDILIFGSTQEEHDDRVAAVLACLQKANVTLNPSKCEFTKSSITFLGQLIDGTGIRPDPNKVKAIIQMRTPKDVTELRLFLGMTNQLCKFLPRITDLTKPLRDLLLHKNEW